MMSGFVRTEIKQFMDCFLPVPVTGQLTGDCWGAEHVLPRDQDNGLEDKVLEDPAITGKVNYTYWDGTILYDKDGCANIICSPAAGMRRTVLKRSMGQEDGAAPWRSRR